jgi:hypothetical protein
MGVLVLPGLVIFAVISTVVGTRLVLLARRTRQLPELLIGVGVLGIGPLGFGSSAAASMLGPSGSPAALPLAVLGGIAAATGVAAKFLFNWRVYRPDERWAKQVALGGTAITLLALFVSLVFVGVRDGMEVPRWYLTRGVLQALCLLWGAAEAVLYWDKMKRRARIGLADPEVTNRFLLWGIAAGSAGLGTAIGVTFQLATGIPSVEVPGLLMSSSLHGLVAAIAMWLAFLPPEFYTRWVRGRAAETAAEAA